MPATNDPKNTLGYIQQNPLNMRPLSGGEMWHGQTTSAHGFCVFSDPRWCFRAWLIEAHSYQRTWGCKNVGDYIGHYAPAGDDNDPATYTRAVEAFMGLEPDQVFDLEARAYDFCRAQMTVEIGGIPYPDDLIREGLSWVNNR